MRRRESKPLQMLGWMLIVVSISFLVVIPFESTAASIASIVVPAAAGAFVLWIEKGRPKMQVWTDVPESSPFEDAMTRKAVQNLSSIDTFQTKAGPVIVSWALAPDAESVVESLIGQPASAEGKKAAIRAKLREILTADPNANLKGYADVLGIQILKQKSPSSSATATGSRLLGLLAKTKDPDEAHVIYEKYLKDRGIQPGSEREARAKAIFSEYMGRLLDPDSE